MYQNGISENYVPEKVPKFITKKWIEVHQESGNANDWYKPSKQIRLKTSMLKSDLYDYSDAYIVVKGKVTVKGATNRDWKNRSLVFKSTALFISCISKINNVSIDNEENVDALMPMYNLSEYSKYYRKAKGSLWNYYRDEPKNPPADNYKADPITNSASFKYIRTIKRTPNNDKIVAPLKCLRNFWRKLDMPLINCEINLILKCLKIVFWLYNKTSCCSSTRRQPRKTSNQCWNKCNI